MSEDRLEQIRAWHGGEYPSTRAYPDNDPQNQQILYLLERLAEVERERDEAAETLATWKAKAWDLCEQVEDAEARLERQQAVVERIKVMHRTSGLATVDYASGPYCLDCKQEWPCNTAAALTQAHPEKEPT